MEEITHVALPGMSLPCKTTGRFFFVDHFSHVSLCKQPFEALTRGCHRTNTLYRI